MKTISSKSGVHYRYYLAQTRSPLLSAIRYTLVNLVLRNQIPLEKWQSEVSIILKKNSKNANMTKLRAILLLKADFNRINKIVLIIE